MISSSPLNCHQSPPALPMFGSGCIVTAQTLQGVDVLVGPKLIRSAVVCARSLTHTVTAPPQH